MEISRNIHALRAGNFIDFLDGLRFNDLSGLNILGDVFFFSELKGLFSDFKQPVKQIPCFQKNPEKSAKLFGCLAIGHQLGGDLEMIRRFGRYFVSQTTLKPPESVDLCCIRLGEMWLDRRDERN